jgi:hypothetical protein
MKKILFFFFIFSLSFAQYDFQQLCLDCAEQNGFFCGDDPANWTQYSPNGCVPNGEGGLFYLNDGWADCTDASDEADAVPTPIEECLPPPPICDTVFIEIPLIEWIYLDCETGLPCGIGLEELINESTQTGLLYNLSGKVIRKPEAVYIENGKIKYKL